MGFHPGMLYLAVVLNRCTRSDAGARIDDEIRDDHGGVVPPSKNNNMTHKSRTEIIPERNKKRKESDGSKQ